MRIAKISVTCLNFLAALFSVYVNAANPEPLWVFPVGASIQSSPAIGEDNTIYFGADNGMLYALSPDGKKKWEFVTSGPIVTTPAISADGTIYVSSVDRIIYAINPDGKERWRLMPGSGLVSSPAIAPDGTIYVGSVFNKFFAISADGFRKWDFPTTGNIISSPAVDATGNVYFGCMDTNFYAVNTNGAVIWVFKLANRMNSSPAIDDDGNIYFGGFDKMVYALDSNGKLIWQCSTEGAVRSSPIIGMDGTIYIGSDDTKLYAISHDGKKKWDFATKEWVRSTPVISAGGTIYFGSYDNNFYAVNTNGELVWKFKTAGYISSSAAIDKNGVVYFGSWDNNFYALKGDAPLAQTPWPAFRKNMRRTGCVVSDTPKITETKPKLPELKIKQPPTTPPEEEKPTVKPVEQKPVVVTVKQPEPQTTTTPQIENEVGERPTIKITAPKNGFRVNEQTITVQGIARHPIGLKTVEYRLNSGSVHQTEGLGQWSAKIKLNEGENLFEVRAISVTGATSDWEKLTINYSPLCQIYLQITGKGKVSPSVAGKKFESGQKVVLKAEPSSKYKFAGWEGAISETSEQIAFVITSNIVLKANFVPEEKIEIVKPKKIEPEPEATAVLNVTVQGNGKVSPYYGEHKLKAGKSYKLTAKPDSGFKFAGWSGNVESQESEITVVLNTNTTIVANFTPLLTKAGKYFGLIYEEETVEYSTTGLIQINLLSDGRWKAKMSFIDESINCEGSFDNNGSSIVSINRGAKPPLAIVLKMQDNPSVINGWITGLDRKTLFSAKPQLADVKTTVGSYTLIMVSPTNTQSEPGDGFARLNIDNSGNCQIEGKLGNGASFSSTVPVVDSTAPVFIPLRKDLIAGWLVFTNSETQTIAGELYWFKSSKSAVEKFKLRPIGSIYEKPGKGENIMDSKNLVIALSGGGLDSIVGSIVEIEPEIKTTFSEVDLKYSFDSNTGFFKGTFLYPGTKKTIKYEGAILQKTKWGSGHFIMENKSGLVFVAPDITHK